MDRHQDVNTILLEHQGWLSALSMTVHIGSVLQSGKTSEKQSNLGIPVAV